MRIEVVTLFPDLILDAVEHGVLGRAIGRGLLSVGTEDPRAHATDVHGTVDESSHHAASLVSGSCHSMAPTAAASLSVMTARSS